MTHDTLSALKWATPFRLVLADGRWLDILDPNHIWPGTPNTLVALPGDPARTWLSLATATIDRVEFPAAAGSD